MPTRATHEQLQTWRFTTTSTALPEQGMAWDLDTASWRLARGELWLEEPVLDGVVTGFVFEGEGSFRITVPDLVELRQLRRFVGDPALETLEIRFDRLVLRGAGGEPLSRLTPPSTAGFVASALARERHEHWLRQRWLDVDAAVIAALANPRTRYLRADMRTDSGWLTYEYDSSRLEEISLEKYRDDHGVLESWLSLDRPEDRDAHGRPSPVASPQIDLVHIDVRADLTETSRRPQRGLSNTQPLPARLSARLRFEPVTAGSRALALVLNPEAKVNAVRDARGRELDFVRDAIGSRSASLDNRYYDTSLLVLLAEPLPEGGEQQLEVDYELDVATYVHGLSWYPTPKLTGAALSDLHTGRLELTFRDDHQARAMGTRIDERTEKKLRTEVWQIDRPAKMLTFCVVKKLHEEVFRFEGLPEVRSFGPLSGNMGEGRIRDIGADVVNSLNFYQKLFGEKLPAEQLVITAIPASHGQAFEGFLHIGDWSALEESVATGELFRAHEVAHQWWGHQVGWASYRDQWLSEALAEYSAMMFVEATVKGGPALFEEMIRAYQDQVLGSLKSSFSRFARPDLTVLDHRALERVGPIGHGWRSAVAEAPAAYFSQVYTKGALVLHMLRILMRQITKSDETFVLTLRDFIASSRGRQATTADFEAAVTRRAPADWSWFFDQWIRGAEIPTYRWSHGVAPTADAQGRYRVTLEVSQSGVSPGFRMAVPVRFELGGERASEALVMIGKSDQTIELQLPEKPRKVIFNPGSAILAKVERR